MIVDLDSSGFNGKENRWRKTNLKIVMEITIFFETSNFIKKKKERKITIFLESVCTHFDHYTRCLPPPTRTHTITTKWEEIT